MERQKVAFHLRSFLGWMNLDYYEPAEEYCTYQHETWDGISVITIQITLMETDEGRKHRKILETDGPWWQWKELGRAIISPFRR